MILNELNLFVFFKSIKLCARLLHTVYFLPYYEAPQNLPGGHWLLSQTD